MRRFLCSGAVLGLLAIVPAAQAKCGTSCLRQRVNHLTAQVNSLSGQLSSIEGQLGSINGELGSANGELGSLNGSVSSLGSRLTGDEGTLSTVNQFVGTLKNCLSEVPITDYGDPNGTFGYVYDQGGGSTFDTTALDATASGDSVSAWVLSDQCALASNPTASASTAHIRFGKAVLPVTRLVARPLSW